jgi:hypothetical protein
MHNMLDQRGWKYPTPDVTSCNPIEFLRVPELEFLSAHLPRDSPVWEVVSAHLLEVLEENGELLE